MAFRTKLDFSNNRQVKQHIETFTVLSGGTSFGVPFNLLPAGPDLTTSGVTFSSTTVLSTFSGNSATTVYTWYYPEMNQALSSLSAITPTISAITQNAFAYSASSYTTIDDNSVATAYSGVSFDITPISVVDLGGGNYAGSVQTNLIEFLSASTLDFTGRTIWNDVSGITRTEDLIITKNPVIGSVWTCIDAEGKGAWSASTASTSGTDVFVTGGTYTTGTTIFTNTTGGTFSVTGFSTGNTTLYWYDENNTPPATAPVASGTGSIALGDGAQALAGNMFVYGNNAGSGATSAYNSNFLGIYAGGNAPNADNSNFFGYQAGYVATDAYDSNFMGSQAGKDATTARYSNFIGISAGYQATNAYESNFIGKYAGYSAPTANQSNFIGAFAGYQATGASISNFIGVSAGYQATGSYDSNFIGSEAGSDANNADASNFIGVQAGNGATYAYTSNFFGTNAGYLASGSNTSNFIGSNAGSQSTNAIYSNFLGNNAGSVAASSTHSNFIGYSAGYQANNTSYTNFMGQEAGSQASGTSYSNFFGAGAGNGATNTTYSNFLGLNAGYLAKNTNYSNFIGKSAGYGATGLTDTNFIGSNAGYGATGASYSNFFAYNSGYQATGASYSNFIGHQAGYQATTAYQSNFIGLSAGYQAKDSSSSNFIGLYAGFQATGSTVSTFIGISAGYQATNTTYSNFIGSNAGYGAKGVDYSNFIGQQAGSSASGSSNSNFIGAAAGNGATDSSYSNFIGRSAGSAATGITYSNFIGLESGLQACDSNYSNFIGRNSGYQASGSNYSNLFGFNVGRWFTSNNIGSNNIIIGTNISLPNTTADSINIGGVLFGINTYNTTTGDPSITATASGKIGIGIVTPTQGLDVALNARIRTIGASASAGALHYDANGVLTTNTSDSRLKSNVTQLTNSLDKIKQLRGVTYNWNENLTGQTRIGFIAQEVEAVVPELTFVNNNSPEKYLGVHYDNVTALLVEAVKELASGSTNASYLETQTILAEDNNIELNYSGTPETALGGGITVLHGMGIDLSSELIIDANGNWITNNDFIPNKITLPTYTPSGSTDTNGNLGNVTRDDDYLYMKTSDNKWKRIKLEEF